MTYLGSWSIGQHAAHQLRRSNPSEVYKFTVKIIDEKDENKQKRPGVDPFLTDFIRYRWEINFQCNTWMALAKFTNPRN